MPTNLDRVRDALVSGAFDPLVGLIEDEVFEFKKEPYQLKTERQKLELAKDVSALANASGGVIVLGLRGKKSVSHPGDEVVEVSQFDESLLDADQYQKIVEEWVYPRLGLEVRWYQGANNTAKGLGAIWVPRQPETVKPFLLAKTTIDPNSDQVTDIVCGISERRLGRVVELSVQEIHGLIKDGRTHRDLSGIQETLRDIRRQLGKEAQQTRESTRLDMLTTRIAELRNAASLSGKPTYVLVVTPADVIEIPSLFEDRSAPVVQLIADPPKLRPRGFGIYCPSFPEIHGGQSRRGVVSGIALGVWIDGTVVYVIDGDDGYLCWNSRKGPPYRVNPLVLLETVFIFLTLARDIYGYAEPTPSGYYCRIELHDLPMQPPVGLIPGGLDAYEDFSEANLAQGADAVIQTKWNMHPIDPGRAGYEMVKKVYNWFRIEDHSIPYTHTADGGIRSISKKAIIAEDQRMR